MIAYGDAGQCCLEETGVAPSGGRKGAVPRGSMTDRTSPLTTHVACQLWDSAVSLVGMAHLVEVTRQMQRRAGTRTDLGPQSS